MTAVSQPNIYQLPFHNRPTNLFCNIFYINDYFRHKQVYNLLYYLLNINVNEWVNYFQLVSGRNIPSQNYKWNDRDI